MTPPRDEDAGTTGDPGRPGSSASEDSRDRPDWWPADEEWPPRRPDGRPDWHLVRERAPWGWWARGRRYGWRTRGAADAWTGPPWARRPDRHGRGFGCLFGLLFLLTAGSVLVLVTSVVLGAFGAALGRGTPGPVQLAAFVVLAACLAGALIAGRALQRSGRVLDDVLGAIARLEAGDYSARVEPPSRGPLPVRQLVDGFNTMAGRLEADERQRRSLLADVSHELRTPLAVLQGNLEGLIDGVYPADEEHLSALLDETRVVSRLVDDLRTLALSESGSLALHPEPTDLGILVAEVAAAFRPGLETAGVRLEVSIDDRLPLLELDPVRTREILANLLANAQRYTPRGGSIVVGAATENGGNWLRVHITDTGVGIPPDLLPHVFDRFWKSPDSRGSGLGLSIAKNLVAAQGGEIGAESRPGEGTSIWFRLPVTLEQSPAEPPDVRPGT